jgi:starvation-inducible DNA-binding protein
MTAKWSMLSEEARQPLGEDLQGTVEDLIDLSLLGKQAHWTVVGAQFRSVHLHLDELVSVLRTWTDTMAERMVAVGELPDGQAHTVAERSEINALPVEWLDGEKVVGLVADRLESVARRCRERLERADDLDDVTENLYEDLLKDLEEQLWMFRAQTR